MTTQDEFCNELIKCLKMFNTRLHECEIEIDLLKAKLSPSNLRLVA